MAARYLLALLVLDFCEAITNPRKSPWIADKKKIKVQVSKEGSFIKVNLRNYTILRKVSTHCDLRFTV